MTRDALRGLCLIGGLGLLLGGTPSCADTGGAGRADEHETPAARPRAFGSRSRPSVATLRAEAVRVLPKDAMSRSMKGLTPRKIEGGIVKLPLEGRFMHASLAVIDERGQTRAACVDGPTSASATQQTP